jgi:hypothetical protein
MLPRTVSFASLCEVNQYSRRCQIGHIMSRGRVRHQIILVRGANDLRGNAFVKVWARVADR